MVESLVKAGALTHITDIAGLTPLMVAVLRAQESQECEEFAEGVVRILVEKDERLDLPDLNGRTALHLASMLRLGPLRRRLVNILVTAGAPLAALDINGDRPVDIGFRLSENTLFE